jgi:rRNA biogenesis protein RRP5
MALVKRKVISESENVRPFKKYKPSVPNSKSLVLKDEESFPRGGASVLTPLEHKRIQIQATEDALFEQTTGTKSARNDFGDEENEEELHHATVVAPTEARRKKPSNEKPGKPTRIFKESGVRIEGLSYKVCSDCRILFVS